MNGDKWSIESTNHSALTATSYAHNQEKNKTTRQPQTPQPKQTRKKHRKKALTTVTNTSNTNVNVQLISGSRGFSMYGIELCTIWCCRLLAFAASSVPPFVRYAAITSSTGLTLPPPPPPTLLLPLRSSSPMVDNDVVRRCLKSDGECGCECGFGSTRRTVVDPWIGAVWGTSETDTVTCEVDA